jgi:integrase
VLPICFPMPLGGVKERGRLRIMKLTQANIARLNLPPGKSDTIYFDDDMPGFGLRLRAGGKRTWIVQYRVGTKQRRQTLGLVERLDAAKARQEAKHRLSAVDLGRDPQQEKYDAKANAANTVAKLVTDYLARRHYETGRDPLRQRSFEATERYLQKHWKPLHAVQADELDRSRVAKLLAEIETEHGTVSAARARAALSGMFVWAVGQGIVSSNPVIGTNKPPEPVARDRVLTDSEVSEIWTACRDDDYGRIIKLLLLTGARRDEIGGLTWEEFDRDRMVIRLPAHRTKNGRPHNVPLSPLALSIFEMVEHREGRDRVFGEGEGAFSGWSAAKRKLDARILEARYNGAKPGSKVKPIEPWRLHDLRRTSATRMAELGVLPHVIEAVLNHVGGHKAGVAGIYNRAAYEREMRTALALWAEHIRSMVDGAGHKVLPLRSVS